MRVIRDGRTGFAYAGTLDARRDRRGARRGARQRRSSAPSTSGPGWPSRTASPSPSSRCGATRSPPSPPTTRSSSPRSSSGSRSPATRASASTTPTTPTRWTEFAVATTTGIRRSGRDNGCYVQVSTLADDGDETQTGFGFSVGARSRRVRPRQGGRRGGRSGDPAARRHQAGDRARLTVVLDPFVTAQFLGIIGSTLNGESVVKGRSLFQDRLGEQVASAARHARRRPDQPAGVHGHRRRRRGPRRPPQRADRRRRAAAVRALELLGAPCRHGVDRQRGARWLRRHARRRVPRAAARARARAQQAEIVAGIDDGLLVQSVSGLHSGVNPISGDFSTGASGMLITQRRGRALRSASSRSPRRCSGCCSTSSRSAPTSTGCRCGAAGVTLVIRDVTMSGA